MAGLIKCDLTGEVLQYEDTYQVTIYNRANKTRCQIDVESNTLMALLKGKPIKVTFAPRWQTWNAEVKKYVDAGGK